MKLVTLLAAFLSTTSFAAQNTEDPARQRDVDSVYEAFLANLPSGLSAGPGTVYAVSLETNPISPIWLSPLKPSGDTALDSFLQTLAARCGEPPQGYESKWEEVRADLDRRGNAPAAVNRGLKVPGSLALVKPDEVSAFSAAQSRLSPQGRVSVLKLGNVYFNRDRTLAVTSISSTCGTLCGHSERRVYQRELNGPWYEVQSASKCVIDS